MKNIKISGGKKPEEFIKIKKRRNIYLILTALASLSFLLTLLTDYSYFVRLINLLASIFFGYRSYAENNKLKK